MNQPPILLARRPVAADDLRRAFSTQRLFRVHAQRRRRTWPGDRPGSCYLPVRCLVRDFAVRGFRLIPSTSPTEAAVTARTIHCSSFFRSVHPAITACSSAVAESPRVLSSLSRAFRSPSASPFRSPSTRPLARPLAWPLPVRRKTALAWALRIDTGSAQRQDRLERRSAGAARPPHQGCTSASSWGPFRPS